MPSTANVNTNSPRFNSEVGVNVFNSYTNDMTVTSTFECEKDLSSNEIAKTFHKKLRPIGFEATNRTLKFGRPGLASPIH